MGGLRRVVLALQGSGRERRCGGNHRGRRRVVDRRSERALSWALVVKLEFMLSHWVASSLMGVAELMRPRWVASDSVAGWPQGISQREAEKFRP